MIHSPLLSEAEQAVIDAAVRVIVGSTTSFDQDVLVAIKDALQAVVPFDRMSVVSEEEDGKSFRVLWRVPDGATGGTPLIPTGTRQRTEYVAEGFGPDPASARPRIVEDIRTRTGSFAQAAARSGLLSYLRVPLVHENAGIGWLIVGHDCLGAPSQRSLPLLEHLARIIGPAVARARLAARYRMLSSLVEESPDGMLALDRGLLLTESNAAAQRMLGRSKEEMLGRPLAELVGESTALLLARAIDDGAGRELPFEIHVGRDRLPIDAVVARVSGTSEATLQIHLRDARARRAAEDATARRVEQLAFQRALGEVMASDLRADKSLARAVDLCFVRFELGALCALRREPDGSSRLVAAHGAGPALKGMLARITATDLERLASPPGASVGAAVTGGRLLESVGVRLPDDAPDAPARWVKLAPLVHARRRLGFLLAVGHAGESPLTADREIWEAIANTISVALHAADDYEQVVALEAEKRQLVDNLPVIVARFEAGTGATLFVNGAVERLLGGHPAETLGAPGFEALFADPTERAASAAARARAAQGKDSLWQDRRYRHKDGRVLTMRERVYPVFDAAGAVRAVELIAYDVTTEIETRKRLMQADRLVSLGALAAGIAHEINNPVAFIGLASAQVGRLIDRMSDPASGAEERLREISRELGEAASRIAEIVGELKLFTRMSDGASTLPIDVNRVLQTALTLTSAELRRRAKLEVELSELPLSPGSFSSLGQVFVNLLINAAQAIDARPDGAPASWPPRGPDGEGQHTVKVTSALEDGSIVVRVSDTGVGIEPRLIPRIFDPFFTTKATGQGAGLGLAIAYDLVQRVGGDIRVKSAPGAGTMFEVRLPLEAPPQSSEDGRTPSMLAEEERASQTLSRRRVLIIDDEHALANALARQLAERFEVDTASTASDALARLAVQGYDAVVCDLRMPDQSGPAIYDLVRARSPGQASRFVFTTGGSYGTNDDELHDRAQATGQPVLEKPFDGASFEAVVARVAAAPSGTVALSAT